MHRVHAVSGSVRERRVVGFRRRQMLRGVVCTIVEVWRAVRCDCMCRCVGYDRRLFCRCMVTSSLCALCSWSTLVRAAAAVRVGDTGGLVATAFERQLGHVHMNSAGSLAVSTPRAVYFSTTAFCLVAIFGPSRPWGVVTFPSRWHVQHLLGYVGELAVASVLIEPAH